MTFNRKAAAAAYDLIMKMDEDEARTFVTLVTVDVLHKTLDDNKRVIERHTDEVINKRAKLMERAIAKSYQKSGQTEDLLEAVRFLENISKANGWKKEKHDRDAKGQFRYMGGEKNKKMHVTPMGGASFDLMSALTSNDQAKVRAAQSMMGLEAGLPSFQQSWTGKDTERNSSNAALYQRIAAGSDLVSHVVPYSSNVQMATAFGGFVGSHGHEAEKVFGPPTRKAMYRYRGTERRPSEDLLLRVDAAQARSAKLGTQLSDADQRSFKRIANAETRKLMIARMRQHNEGKPANKQISVEALKPTKEETAAGRLKAKAEFADATEGQELTNRDAARRESIIYLKDHLPERMLNDLQIKSGHTPPSEGVIIDTKGKVTVQALGYGDDHYLPFNLKNLKALKGGEYVRTRSVGGPTSEDIYTGLMSGARRLTVVSRSGVFTVDYRDEFRGGRRYNQKAGRMTSRYEYLLDAVNSGQVTRKPMDHHRRNEISRKVDEEFKGQVSAETLKSIKAKRIRDEMDNNTLTDDEETAVQTQIDRVLSEEKDIIPDSPRARMIASDIRSKALDDKATQFQLNGTGYEAALHALREQFPYYIKHTKQEPLSEGHYEGGSDTGYVFPGHNRPGAARAGLYGDKNIESSKTDHSAAIADYQGYFSTKGSSASTGSGGGVDGENKDGTTTTSTGDVNEDKLRKEKREKDNKKNFQERLVKEREILMDPNKGRQWTAFEGDKDYAWMTMGPDALEEWAIQPKNKQMLIAQLDDLVRQFGPDDDDLVESHGLMKIASGSFGRAEYDPETDLLTTGAFPFAFPKEGLAFTPGQDAEVYEKALKKYADMPHFSKGPSLAERTDQQYQMEIDVSKEYLRRVENAQKLKGDGDEVAEARRDILKGTQDGTPLWEFTPVKVAMEANNTEAMKEHIINVQKARTIKDASQSATGEVTPAAPAAPVAAEAEEKPKPDDAVAVQPKLTPLADIPAPAAPVKSNLQEQLAEAAETYKGFAEYNERIASRDERNIMYGPVATEAHRLADDLRSASERNISSLEVDALKGEIAAFQEKHRLDLANYKSQRSQ